MESILKDFEDYCKRELARFTYHSSGGIAKNVIARLNEMPKIVEAVNPTLTARANELLSQAPKEKIEDLKAELRKIVHSAIAAHYKGEI